MTVDKIISDIVKNSSVLSRNSANFLAYAMRCDAHNAYELDEDHTMIITRGHNNIGVSDNHLRVMVVKGKPKISTPSKDELIKSFKETAYSQLGISYYINNTSLSKAVAKEAEEFIKPFAEEFSRRYNGLKSSISGKYSVLSEFWVNTDNSGNCGMFFLINMSDRLKGELFEKVLFELSKSLGKRMIIMSDRYGGVIDKSIKDMESNTNGSRLSLSKSDTVINGNSGNEILSITVIRK